MDFTLIHRGFDGLDLSYKGNIRVEFLQVLEAARDRAGATRQPQLVRLADKPMLVQECGARGGYRFVCDTGPFGAVWFLKKPSRGDPWGIRVSSRSLPLALFGIEAVFAEMSQVISALTGSFCSNQISLARVDYALDYLVPGFELEPNSFVMHSRLTRASDGYVTDSGQSGSVNSIRIGKMPGKQVAVYDKRKDVLVKKKHAWWDLWNTNLRASSRTEITPASTKDCLWRIETRGGKTFLNERCGIRTMEDLRIRGQSAFLKILDEIRLTIPLYDSNRARWPSHPIWKNATMQVENSLREMIGGAAEPQIREVYRQELINSLTDQIIGCEASLASALNLHETATRDIISQVSERLISIISKKSILFEEKMAAAKDRYFFLT